MSKGFLVDSSTWVEALRQTGSPEAKEWLRIALLQGSVLIASPIKAELLSDATGEKQFAELKEELEALPLLAREREVWEACARLNFQLRRRGVNIPLIDTLIAAWAMVHGAVLVHHDRHFELIKDIEESLETLIVPGFN